MRRQMLRDPAPFLQAAQNALAGQQKKVRERAAFLQACYRTCAKAAIDLCDLAGAFAQKLPQSVFGVGNGSEFLLPLDGFFEKLRAYETGFDRLILKLDPFWQPDPFEPSRYRFLESVLPEANMAKEAEKVGAKGEAICRGAQALSEGIEALCQTVIESFFTQMGEAAGLNGNGDTMRFGRMRALCGELQSAVVRFAKTCETELAKFENDCGKGDAEA